MKEREREEAKGGRQRRVTEWQSDRWRWRGEEVNQRGKGDVTKARRRRGDSRVRQNAENKWQWGRRGKMRGMKVQRDTMTAEGKEREDRLRRSYISNLPTAKKCFLSQQFPERTNCVEKQQLWRWERKTRERERRKKSEPEKHFLLPGSLPPRLKLSDSAVCAEGILLWQNMDLSHWHLSLPHWAATNNSSANKVQNHKCIYLYMHVQMC